jgi:hypothetical protein
MALSLYQPLVYVIYIMRCSIGGRSGAWGWLLPALTTSSLQWMVAPMSG